MTIRTIGRAKQLLSSTLPPAVYVALAKAIYPIARSDISPDRHFRFVSFSKTSHLIKWPDGYIFITSPLRIPIYMGRRGLQGRLDAVYAKYTGGLLEVSLNDLVLDVGANIGEFTLAAARRAKRVIAFEPDPSVFQNLQLNSLYAANIEARQELLSDREGATPFYISFKDADSSLIKPKAKAVRIELTATTLDGLVEREGISRIDFLKMDAEGAEPEVLAGGRKALMITRKLAIDCGPERHGETTLDTVRPMLHEAGFELVQHGSVLLGRQNSRGA